MKNLTYATCLVLFMLSVVSCGNTTAQSVSRVSSTPFVVDSTLQIKNIQDLRIIEHSLYLTYDYVEFQRLTPVGKQNDTDIICI